jgi:hypothetical protein
VPLWFSKQSIPAPRTETVNPSQRRRSLLAINDWEATTAPRLANGSGELDDHRLLVLAEYFPHRVRDFAYRRACFHRRDDVRHQV